MRNRIKWLLGGALAGAIATVALAQTGLFPTSFNGFESVSMAQQGPGSQSVFVLSGMLRNTTGGLTQSATSGTLTWPTTSVGGVSATSSQAQYSTIVYTGSTASVTQNLPANPFDGQVVELVNGTSGNITLTTAVTDGATQVPSPCLSSVTVSANASKQIYYLASSKTWYLMR